MATLTYNGGSFAVDHAAKGADYIHGYDANGVLVVAFEGVTDFSGFTYDGDYMAPSECLAEHCNTVIYCGGALKTLDGRWVNPPMLEGVEYRTTEHWNGKPVYRKLVAYSVTGSVGNSSGYKDLLVPHGITGLTHVVSCNGSIGPWSGLLPYVADGGGITTVTSVDEAEICLKFYKDVFNDPTFYFELAYVKE